MRWFGVLIALFAVALPGAACGQNGAAGSPQQADLRLRPFASGFDSPVYVGATRSEPGKLYVVEQPGVIRVLLNGQLRAKPFLDIRSLVKSGGEQGLLSVAFHPRYARNHRFFVDYTDRNGDTRVVEYRSNGTAALPKTAHRLLFVDQPFDNHNGGQLQFGPDGRLYVGMGDGGSGGDPENRAQNPSSLLGKLLSINVDGGDGKPALAAIGLRNPWRFSFSPDGSQILIGDVGQNAWEEIDRAPFPLPDNANFGWRLLGGTHEFAEGGAEPEGYIPPVFEYSHEEGGCSVTGGVEIGGVYLFGDYCSSKYWVLVGDKTTPVDVDVPAPVSFGQDGAGNLLVASGDGGVYALTPN